MHLDWRFLTFVGFLRDHNFGLAPPAFGGTRSVGAGRTLDAGSRLCVKRKLLERMHFLATCYLTRGRRGRAGRERMGVALGGRQFSQVLAERDFEV